MRQSLIAMTQTLNVLIVEDDEIQVKLIEGLLRQLGFSSISVKDVHGALEKIQSETFNLVISDINLPGGISGFNFVKTIRSIESVSNIPVIFVSGRRDKNDIERALQQGVDDYIIKPIDPDILLSKIEALVSTQGKVFQFNERPVQSRAHLSIPFEVNGISEQAVQLISPVPLPHNFKMKFQADLFDEIGLEPQGFRVTSCEALKNEVAKYRIRANFIGLSVLDMNAIRRWLITNQPRLNKL